MTRKAPTTLSHPTACITPTSEHAALLRRAAALLRERSAVAPRGPYLLDDHTQPDGTRWLLGDDGDPIAHTRYWCGGLHDDTGDEVQTGRFLELWNPALAAALADWLEGGARRIDCCTPRAETAALLTTARALLRRSTQPAPTDRKEAERVDTRERRLDTQVATPVLFVDREGDIWRQVAPDRYRLVRLDGVDVSTEPRPHLTRSNAERAGGLLSRLEDPAAPGPCPMCGLAANAQERTPDRRCRHTPATPQTTDAHSPRNGDTQ